jgi:hypothetical protein
MIMGMELLTLQHTLAETACPVLAHANAHYPDLKSIDQDSQRSTLT